MIYNLYSIRDKKSEFAAPVPVRDNDQAMRWFDNQIKTNAFMTEYKDDFELYKVGTFDTETGKADKVELVEYIMSGSEVNTLGSKNETF